VPDGSLAWPWLGVAMARLCRRATTVAPVVLLLQLGVSCSALLSPPLLLLALVTGPTFLFEVLAMPYCSCAMLVVTVVLALVLDLLLHYWLLLCCSCHALTAMLLLAICSGCHELLLWFLLYLWSCYWLLNYLLGWLFLLLWFKCMCVPSLCASLTYCSLQYLQLQVSVVHVFITMRLYLFL
jgi:hypothetical protein